MEQPRRGYEKKGSVLYSMHGVPSHAFVVWASLMALPVLLVIGHAFLLLHDLKAPKEMLHCWQTEHGGPGLPGPAWLGRIMHWLSKDWFGDEYHCKFVLHPYGIYVQTLFLLPTWVVVIWSSFQTRQLLMNGFVRKLVDHIFGMGNIGQGITYKDCINRGGDQVKKLLDDLETWRQPATWRHVGYMCAFQVAMFSFDWFVKGHPLRFILHDQVLWFSFSETAFLQVGLLNMYCVQLSLTLVDFFLESILSPTEENEKKFLLFTKFHIQLQKDLLQLWGSINLHAVSPALPYLMMSFSQLLYPDSEKGLMMATFLLSMFGVVFYMTLGPIANISSCFNSSFVLRGEPSELARSAGSMAIVAAVRNMTHLENREPDEDQRYSMFLHYVEGCDFHVSLGIPNVVRVPITSATLKEILSAVVLKFPAFISIYMAIQKYISLQNAHVS